MLHKYNEYESLSPTREEESSNSTRTRHVSNTNKPHNRNWSGNRKLSNVKAYPNVGTYMDW